jgi:hypothetical protein
MTNTKSEIEFLIGEYSVLGGDGASNIAVSRSIRNAEVVEVSVAFARLRRGGATYRMVRLSDGRRFLACRHRLGAPFVPVFSVERARNEVA